MVAHYRVNAPDVLHETIEGEVILVNMVTGAYYSVDEVGAVIWQYLADREAVSIDCIVDGLVARYVGDRDTIASGVERLIDEMEREGLVAPGAPSGDATSSNPVGGAEVATNKVKYSDPVLQKYTDMQQLLLLDPIHEVDEAGWPVEKTD